MTRGEDRVRARRGEARQCGKILVIENEKIAGRITLLLVGKHLGY